MLRPQCRDARDSTKAVDELANVRSDVSLLLFERQFSSEPSHADYQALLEENGALRRRLREVSTYFFCDNIDVQNETIHKY